jgi:hypothetical protein
MPVNLKLDGNIQAPYITTNGTNLITVPATTGTMACSSNTGTSGQVLTSNGAGVAPSFQNASGGTITSWVQYTPTFTGLGTCTSVNVWSRRVGDTLEIMGTFTLGTPTATEARITLGYAGSNSNVTSSNTVITAITFAGNLLIGSATASTFYTLIEANTGYLTLSRQSGSNAALTKINGNTFSAGEIFSINAKVPIASFP